MSTNGKHQKTIILLFLVNAFVIMGSRLPKFVDQQLNNQINEVISDIMIPLQSIPCFENIQVNCFRIRKVIRSLDYEWQFVEFQVSSHFRALEHKFKLIAYDRIPDLVNRDNIIFETDPIRPDLILMDLIIDISPFRKSLFQQIRNIYFLLVCADCDQQPISGKSENSIAFLIIKQNSLSRRLRRSVSKENECGNQNKLTNCCLQKLIVDKTIVFDNSSKIVAPNTIPVTYCRGSCYLDMYQGNHNFALLKYYHSLSGTAKSQMRAHLPCCSARQFQNFYILYEMPNDNHEMISSKNLVVESCLCQ